MMRSGWFRESYRHGLAARGISTSRYFSRFGRAPFGKERERKAKFPSGPKQRLPGSRIDEFVPGSTEAEPLRRSLQKDPEEYLKGFSVQRSSPEEKAEFFRARSRLAELKEEIGGLETDPSLLENRKKIADLSKGLRSLRDIQEDITELKSVLAQEDDQTMRDALEERIGKLEDERDSSSGIRERIGKLQKADAEVKEQLRELRKERGKLMDRVDVLSGVGPRKETDPGFLTNEQLMRRLKRAGVEDVEEMSRDQLVGLVREKAPILRPRETTLPVLTKIRSEAVEELKRKQKFVGGVLPPAGELRTVPIGVRGKPGRQQMVVSIPVEVAVERQKEAEAMRVAALERARESRAMGLAPQQEERREKRMKEKARREIELLKKEGMESMDNEKK